MRTRGSLLAAHRAHGREHRAKVSALREQLRHAIASKKSRMRDLTRFIRAERLALRERLRAERSVKTAEIRTAAIAERAAVRNEWQRRLREARSEGRSTLDRLRGELRAHRQQQAAQRLIDRAARADRFKHARFHHNESDEEVRRLIPRELVPLFDKAPSSFQGSPSQSRAEAFLEYAEKNGEAVFKTVDPAAHRHIEATRAELTEASRGSPSTAYASKRTARIERMRGKAAKLNAASEAARASSQRIADRIPVGQPILIGHHSQRRHERDLKRIRKSFSKSVSLATAAADLNRRADRAAKSTAVSSDDPDAVDKLREKLARINAARERMRAANAAIRAGGDAAGRLVALGFRTDEAAKLLKPDFAGRLGFPDYAHRNAASEAGRLERRIEQLEVRTTSPAPPDVVIGDGRISETENRVRIRFSKVPSDALRRELKQAGFRWAPTVGVWQRHASPGSWFAAKRVLGRHGVLIEPGRTP